MRVMVTIQHPGHVHFFKHAICEMERRGHQVFVFARENEMTRDLLESYGIEFEMLAHEPTSILSLAAVQATYEIRLLRRARRIRPDVITAIGGVGAAHVAKLVDARSVVFYDTEHATIIKRLAYPFATVVCTPESYRGSIGSKHVQYPGFHELAYLHPSRFDPDPSVRGELGLDSKEPVAVCRFSNWVSSHDVGEGGFDDLTEVVRTLADAGAHVVVSSEVPVPDDVSATAQSVAPHRMHDLLATANVVVSEGATTAAEAAVLGTPAIYVNSQRMGYTDELADRYKLLFSFNGSDRHERGIACATSTLRSDRKGEWRERVGSLHQQTVDVTEVIVSVVETTGNKRRLPSSTVPTQIRT